jgi:hypothetical protein
MGMSLAILLSAACALILSATVILLVPQLRKMRNAISVSFAQRAAALRIRRERHEQRISFNRQRQQSVLSSSCKKRAQNDTCGSYGNHVPRGSPMFMHETRKLLSFVKLEARRHGIGAAMLVFLDLSIRD